MAKVRVATQLSRGNMKVVGASSPATGSRLELFVQYALKTGGAGCNPSINGCTIPVERQVSELFTPG